MHLNYGMNPDQGLGSAEGLDNEAVILYGNFVTNDGYSILNNLTCRYNRSADQLHEEAESLQSDCDISSLSGFILGARSGGHTRSNAKEDKVSDDAQRGQRHSDDEPREGVQSATVGHFGHRPVVREALKITQHWSQHSGPKDVKIGGNVINPAVAELVREGAEVGLAFGKLTDQCDLQCDAFCPVCRPRHLPGADDSFA
ncbi:MAG TPA: hypothetical protein VHE78_03130 [Gemmatimonadaceae bacterium]|nr:hypothetical protein [Gemmatimonadaceae bacterium]